MSIGIPKVDGIDKEIKELFQNKQITKITRELLDDMLNSINQSILDIKTKGSRKSLLIQDIEVAFLELRCIVDEIRNQRQLLDKRNFLAFLLTTITSIKQPEVIIIYIDGIRSPRCRLRYIVNSEAGFILEIPKIPDCLDPRYLGILAHEAAHIDMKIHILSNSINQEQRKISEGLADILAYCLIEYMFTSSCSNYVDYLNRYRMLTTISESHPSWSTRIFVLNEVTKDIWNEPELIRRNSELLVEISKKLPGIPNTENQILAKVLREARKRNDEIRLFRPDEDVLKCLKGLKKGIVETMDIRIQKMYEAITWK